MSKYKVLIDGEEEDEVFGRYEEAEEYALQWINDWHVGGEILELSNPGDYPYDPNDEPDYEIVEFDD